jgi:hypothetical protein
MLDDVATYIVLTSVVGQLAALVLVLVWLSRDRRTNEERERAAKSR